MSARADIIPVFVPHLGCPHACVFCNQRRISGAEKPADAGAVREAIRRAETLPRGKKRELAFYGGSFTAIPEDLQLALLSAAKEALDAGAIDAIRLSTRPDAIDDVILARLKTHGVETVELGAQSMDDTVLRVSNRGHTALDVLKASEKVKAAGFRLILQMMTGLPGDTPGRCVETARRIIRCRPDGVRIYPTVIVKDTELYDLWQRGAYREHTVEDAVSICARIVPLFERAGIPVIRLGLNPTEELSGGAAAGGAYHPALGELVKSRILRNKAEKLLQGIRPGSRVILEVHPSQISQMTGQHRQNIDALTERFALSELRVRAGDTERGTIRVIAVDDGTEKKNAEE